MNKIKAIFKSKSIPSKNMADRVSEEIQSPINIFDVGCRWGFAERFIDPKYQGIMKVFGFDPDKDECERLRELYKAMPPGYVNCIPLALANESGFRNLYVTKEPACSSIFPPRRYLSENYPALDIIELKELISINVDRLSNWIEREGLNSIDYIKVDTQGSELDVLKGAGDYLTATRCIDVEVEFNPIYEGQNLFWEVDQFLRSKGFELWRFSNLVHYSKGAQPVVMMDVNRIHYDREIHQESKAFGGQLFWADARYVNMKVFSGFDRNDVQMKRDLILFEALGMSDIVAQLKRQAQ